MIISDIIASLKKRLTDTQQSIAPVMQNVGKTIGSGFSQANTQMGNAYKNFAITPQKVQFMQHPIQAAQQGIQNWAQKNPVQAQKISNMPSTEIPYMNKTFTMPNVHPLVTDYVKYVGAPQAEALQKGIQSYQKYKMGQAGVEDLGNIAGGVGAINPTQPIMGGAFGAVMKAGENVLNKQPITNDLYKGYRQGFEFQAKLGPISEGTGILLKPILSKLNSSGMQAWNTYIKLAQNPNMSQAARTQAWGLLRNAVVKQVGEKALSGFIGMGTLGATLPAKSWEERLKNTIDQGLQGAVFEAGNRVVGQSGNVALNQVKDWYAAQPKNKPGFFAGEHALGFDNAKRKFSALTDQKTRFEVSDRQAYLKKDNISPSIEKGVVPLQDVFQHEGLYRQYPEFKRLRVSFDATGHTNGSFNEGTFSISINPNLPKSEIRSTLLHEVQHAVQAREGFARGGSPTMFKQQEIKISQIIDGLNKEMGDLIKRNDQMDPITQGQMIQWNKNRYNALLEQRDYFVKKLLNTQDEYGLSGVGGYKRLAGEIEARDVQARMNLSPEQRKNSQPYASQGVPLKDQIIQTDRGDLSSSVDLTPEQSAAKSKLPGILFDTNKAKAEGRGKVVSQLPWETPEYLKRNPKIDTQTEILSFTKEQIDAMAADAQFKSDTDKTVFKDLFSKWIGQKEAAKTTGVEVGASLRPPKNLKGEDIIRAIENPEGTVPKGAENYIGNLRTQYDSLIKNANREGIKIPYRENYITHIWKGSQEQVAQAYQVLKQKFGYGSKRLIPTYDEGIALGKQLEAAGQPNPFIPKYTNPSQIIAEYTRKLEQTKADIEFFKALKKNGFIVSKRMPGFEPITAQGFNASTTRLGDQTIREGIFFAPKKIAEAINQVFNPQESVLAGTAKLSSKIQDVAMSGGVPATPINAWTSAQVIKELTAGRVRGPLKALWNSMYEGSSNKYFQENAPLIKEQQLNNVPISTTFNVDNLAPKSVLQKIFGSKISEVWSKTVNEATFKRFMPILQTEFYKDVKTAALKANKTPEEAIQIAAEATKNWYGMTSTADNALRNRTISDAASTFLFAPKYRESMINFWIRDLKAISPIHLGFENEGIKKVIPTKISLNNPLSLQNRANTKFIIGAGVLALTMNKLNEFFNDGRSMPDNPPGTEDKLLIPVGKLTGNTKDKTVIGIPFLSSIATVPRALFREGMMLAKGDVSAAGQDALQTYSSMGIKPLTDVVANQDYYGKSIIQDNMTRGEKLAAQGKYLFTQYVGAHPYIKELFTPSNQDDPAYQRLSRAMELPIRYYDKTSLDTKYYFGAKDKAITGLNDQEQQAFNAIPKADTNDPNIRILKYQIYLTYPNVFEAKQKTELETAAKTGKGIDPLYLVNYDTAKKYMRYEALPEGSQDRKDMTKAYPELLALFDVRNKFFTDNPIPGQKTNSRKPIASAYVQSQMDAKNWSDPQVKQYLDANTAYNNEQRATLGLPPLAGYTQFAKQGYKKVTARKVSFKHKQSKLATIKLKSSKVAAIKWKKSNQKMSAKLIIKKLKTIA